MTGISTAFETASKFKSEVGVFKTTHIAP